MDYADFEIAKQQSDKNIKWGTFGVIPNVYSSFKITKQLRNGIWVLNGLKILRASL